MDRLIAGKEPIKMPEPYEVDVPAQRETFEAQVLVVSKPSKKMMHSFPYLSLDDARMPLGMAYTIIQSGKFKAELIVSSLANGKPTLLITEE